MRVNKRFCQGVSCVTPTCVTPTDCSSTYPIHRHTYRLQFYIPHTPKAQPLTLTCHTLGTLRQQLLGRCPVRDCQWRPAQRVLRHSSLWRPFLHVHEGQQPGLCQPQRSAGCTGACRSGTGGQRAGYRAEGRIVRSPTQPWRVSRNSDVSGSKQASSMVR